MASQEDISLVCVWLLLLLLLLCLWCLDFLVRCVLFTMPSLVSLPPLSVGVASDKEAATDPHNT